MIKLKRTYDDYESSDNFRILIDRMWPRGLSKKTARIDRWMKDIAPSGELIKWFSHDVSKWMEFKKRYHEELNEKQDLSNELKLLEREKGTITLLYSAKDQQHNNALVLLELLK